MRPLLSAGAIELRRIDMTPADWWFGRVVREEWRITAAGRDARASEDAGAALKEPDHG